jgi:hypothetical protein
MAADKALQRAMQLAYLKDQNPALWAGFSVFGTPQKIPKGASTNALN